MAALVLFVCLQAPSDANARVDQSFAGWGYVRDPYGRTTIPAWRWNAATSQWSVATLTPGTPAYLHGWSRDWEWVWTASTGWLAIQQTYVSANPAVVNGTNHHPDMDLALKLESSNISLVTTAVDDSGPVESVTFKVDGSVVATDRLAPFTHSLATSSLTAGQHIVSATAVDQTGRSSTTDRTILVTGTSASKLLPAFPGAVGHGSTATGGRGGQVIFVTTLANDGPGSLRAALSATGKRTVIFRVGGTIQLTSMLVVSSGDLTVAGQTAPGDGIVLRGAGLSVQASNVIIRGLRVRFGDDGRVMEDDALKLGSTAREVRNVIFDHNSVSWATDENMSSWNGRVHDVSFSWNIIAQGLRNSLHSEGPHSMGMIIGQDSRNVSIHHNFFAHNADRNPLINGDTEVEIVNNAVYGWGSGGATKLGNGLSGPQLADVVGNMYRANSEARRTGATIDPPVRINNVSVGSSVHVAGNIGPGRFSDTADEWSIVTRGVNADASRSDAASASRAVVATSATSAWSSVLASAGATSPRIDAIDAQFRSNAQSTTGSIIDCVLSSRCATQPLGASRIVAQLPWLNMPTGLAPSDTDRDGMPDVWETVHGLNAGSSADAQRVAADGYTNLERYLNSLIPVN